MNLNDLNSRVDSSRKDAARVNRSAAQANPDYDAGMEDDNLDDFFNTDDNDFGSGGFSDFGSSPSGGFDSLGGGFDSLGGGMNTTPASSGGFASLGGGMNTTPSPTGFGFGDMMGTSNQQAQNTGDPEDKLFDAAAKMGKSSVNMFKDLISSFKSFDAEKRATTGRFAMVISGVCLFCSILLLIFGRQSFGFELLLGSMTSEATGILLLCFAQSSLSKQKPAPAPTPVPTPEPTPAPAPASDSDGFSDEDIFSDSDEDEYDDDDFYSDYAPEPAKQEFTDDFSWAQPNEPDPEPEVMSTTDMTQAKADLETLPDRGIIDRRTLFERANSVLNYINKDFGKHTEIAQGSDLFNTLDTIVQDSAENFRTNSNDELPYLISAVDTLFYIRLDIHRVKYIKNIEAYTKEIVNIFQYDRNTGKRDERIYGVGDVVGNEMHIKLMKGESVMVSLRDIYAVRSENILDMDNKMPVVLGIDIEGDPVIRDFKTFNSLLVTGAPRTGKSWLLQAMIWQMMLYYSPEDLWIYYLDPKGSISDFTTAITPHVKKFVTTDDNIVAQLEQIVRVEGPRRQQIIGEAGFVNLDDYKKKFPGNHDMPYIYVMIDEVVTLADRMDKDVKTNFQGLLSELVSRLPAVGIRLFMVPHLVKDNIIKKNTTSLIPCRISVMGNAEHIESSCGVKNFPHQLINRGDTCTVLAGEPKPLFVHGVVLSKTNDENAQLFNYIAELWAKICPNSVAGSVYERKLKDLPLFDDTSVSIKTKIASAPSEFANPRASMPDSSRIEPDVQAFFQEKGILERGNNKILNNPVEEIDLFDDE